MDFKSRRISVTESKMEKIRATADPIISLSARSIPMKDFRRMVSRLSWASQILTISRAFLGPLYALMHVKALIKLGRIPMNRFRKIIPNLQIWLRIISLATLIPTPSSDLIIHQSRCIIRVDACGDEHGACIGGWCGSIEEYRNRDVAHFAFRVSDDFFPVHSPNRSRQISALEILASAIAYMIWGNRLGGSFARLRRVTIHTDSKVGESASKRWYSPSPNLQRSLGLLIFACVHFKIRSKLIHIPGKKNILADALSRYPSSESRKIIFGGSHPLNPSRQVTMIPPIPMPEGFSIVGLTPVDFSPM